MARAGARPQVVNEHRDRIPILDDRYPHDLTRRFDGDGRIARPELGINLAPTRKRLRIEVDDRTVREQGIVERPGVRYDVVGVAAIGLHLVQDGDRVPGSLREDDIAAGVVQAVPPLGIARSDAPPLQAGRRRSI